MIVPARLVFLGFLTEDKIGCIEKADFLKGRTAPDFERVEFWEEPNKEIMAHSSIDEFVEDFLEFSNFYDTYDCLMQQAIGKDELKGKGIGFPETIKVHGYARTEISLGPGSTLEGILEWLDEEYGNPDSSDHTEPTNDMLEAEAKLHEAILKGYQSWMCEPVVEVVVNLKKWRGAP